MISNKYGHNELCTNVLKQEFTSGIYTKEEDVDRAFEICRDVLISEFEKECTRLNTIQYVKELLRIYSSLSSELSISNSIGNKTKETIVIIKKMCKNVFGEITKYNLEDNSKTVFDNILIDRIMHISDSLLRLSQENYLFYIINNSGFQLELLDDRFAFTMYDKEVCEKFNDIARNIPIDYFRGMVSCEHLIEEFKDKSIEAFGDVASEFYDIIFFDDSPIIIDDNEFTEEDFISLLSSPSECKSSPERIVDLTELVNKYPNNPFLQGLTLCRNNVNMTGTYTHPHKYNRSRFKPILQILVNGITKYITTTYLIFEALSEYISNQLPFGLLPTEWEGNVEMKRYAKNQSNKHDKWLEDAVETVLAESGYAFCRNIESIDNIALLKASTSISGKNVGEIDFIIIDAKKRNISIVDCKYLKTKSDFANFGDDKSKFTKGKQPYEQRLILKYEWVKGNFTHLQNELKNRRIDIDILGFSTDLFFITNAPTYYGFFSKYPIIPISQLRDHLIK